MHNMFDIVFLNIVILLMNKRFIEISKTKHNNIIFSKGAILVHRIYAKEKPKTKYKI